MKIALYLTVAILMFGTLSCNKKYDGVVMFYVVDEPPCGAITIKIGEQTITLDQAEPSGVDCMSLEVPQFMLQEGTHKYHATDGCNSWRGAVTADPRNCWFEVLHIEQ